MDFVNQDLGFTVVDVQIPLVGDAVLDEVEGAAPSVGQKIEGESTTPVVEDQTGMGTPEDIFFISDALLNLPTMIWTKLPEREPERVKTFNKELHRYCVRKGINPWDYFFSEFGMVMAVLPILVSYKNDYSQFYGKDKKKTKDDKLNIDYDHAKELEDKKEVVEDER